MGHSASSDTDPVVTVAVAAGVATITLASPANRNALSQRLITDLHRALDRAEQPDVRVIVLGHVDPTFSAGADLKERASGGAAVDSTGVVGAMERLMYASQPSIAAVRGSVRAGGIGLMAACDLVVVHPDVTFAFTEVRIGVAPAIISVPILQRTPWSQLAGPFLTGEVFSAATAKEMGLVTHVASDVDATVAALTDGILAGAPTAVAATKRLLRPRLAPGAFADAQAISEALFRSPDGMEGMAAFAEKRQPRWVAENAAGTH